EPHGIIVPMISPFKGKNMEDLDLDAAAKLVHFLIENGVDALMVNGTSGEFLLQSVDERKRLIRAVVREANGWVPVIAGISEPSTKHAIDLGIDAEDAGADAIITTGPIYYKTSEEALYHHFEAIIKQVRLPLMIYNIPSWIGYDVPANLVKKLIENYPARICGVKFTTDNLGQFLNYLRELSDLIPITIGSDALLLSGLELGAAGGTIGSANVLPSETAQIYDHYMKGEFSEARKIQRMIDDFTVAMGLGCFPAGIKEGLKVLGIGCGDVRSPLLPLNADEGAKVAHSLSWKKRGQIS
ncbi:MAG: dihydrodipicolinate synthase family protein, partial [Nitrososphaerales archaeon]